MDAQTIVLFILCVAVGIALSELVFLGLLVAIHSAKDRWDHHQWRKRNSSSRLTMTSNRSCPGEYLPVFGNIIWNGPIVKNIADEDIA